jgi:uncharacterized membrane protein
MLLLSGFWMFIEHTSLNIQELQNYYSQKSFFGLLETVSPHLFGMGVVIFTLTHFLALKNKNSSIESKLSIILFILMITSNLSGFFISDTSMIMDWIKLFSTLSFLILSILIMIKVYHRTT